MSTRNFKQISPDGVCTGTFIIGLATSEVFFRDSHILPESNPLVFYSTDIETEGEVHIGDTCLEDPHPKHLKGRPVLSLTQSHETCLELKQNSNRFSFRTWNSLSL